MLLQDKVAIVYGGAGALGGAAARKFAAEGARVFLAGRTLENVEAVAREIVWSGGRAEAASVDAMDQASIERHADAVVRSAGGIDVMLNAVGVPHVQGTPLSELSHDEYAVPLHGYCRTNFLTAKTAAVHMVKRGRGVILTISTPGSQMAGAGFMGYGAACAAVEAMTRHLAGELGPSGVRAVCLRSEAIPEALAQNSHAGATFRKMAANGGFTVEGMLAERAQSGTLLKRFPRLGEFAEVAAFMASDRASAITAAVVNMTCGSLID